MAQLIMDSSIMLQLEELTCNNIHNRKSSDHTLLDYRKPEHGGNNKN